MKSQATEYPRSASPRDHRAAFTRRPTVVAIGLLARLLTGLLLAVLVGCASLPVATPQTTDSTPTVPAESTPASVATPSAEEAPAQTTPTVGDSAAQTLVDAVAAATRHFQGDPDAPVTVIEFGDFR